VDGFLKASDFDVMGSGRLPNGVYWIKTPVEPRAFVSILKKFRGYATTLITPYINSGRSIPDVACSEANEPQRRT
jgi:hypothetical protein